MCLVGNQAKSATHTIVIEAMFLELYQERLIDLLVDRKDKSDEDSLSIREHPVSMAGLRWLALLFWFVNRRRACTWLAREFAA